MRNADGTTRKVLTVSNKHGFIKQKDHFNGYSVASENIDHYKVVAEGDCAYNPSRVNVGSIACLDKYKTGVVSPMYVVFSVNKQLLDNCFMLYMLTTHYMKHLININTSGSVRDSLNFSDLCTFRVRMPGIREQKKIASFLSTVDTRIDILSRQIGLYGDWKKGLLQKMFVS